MKKFVFYKRDEIQKAKKEKRNAVYGFTIETDFSTLSKLVKILDLEMDWTFTQI